MSELANRALAIKILAALTTYGFTIFLAREMLPQEFGKIALFLNLSLVLSVVGAHGQQLSVLRFMPQLCAQSNQYGLSELTRWTSGRCAIGTVTIFLLALAVAFIAKSVGRLPNLTPAQITLGIGLIPIVGWIDLQSHMARAHQYLALSLIPKDIIWRLISIVTLFLVSLLVENSRMNATTVLAVLVATLASVAAVQFFILRRLIISPGTQCALETDLKQNWNSASNPFWITSVSNIFLANADVILVGIFGGSTAAGIYFVANRLAMMLAFFSTSTNFVLAPLMARTNATGSRNALARTIHRATAKVTVPTVAAGIILVAFAPEFLRLFGTEFIQATPALRILVLAAIINAATGPADIVLNMCGFHRSAMRASAFTLAISLILLVFGAAFGGVTGVAIAVLLATTVRKALFWWLVLGKLSIRTDIIGPSRHHVAAS